MKPPPPMLPADGCTTASAKAVATAASTAVPPSSSTRAPICDAIWFCEATMPPCARTGTELAPRLSPSVTTQQTIVIERHRFFMRPPPSSLSALRARPALPARPALLVPRRLHFNFEQRSWIDECCHLHGCARRLVRLCRSAEVLV